MNYVHFQGRVPPASHGCDSLFVRCRHDRRATQRLTTTVEIEPKVRCGLRRAQARFWQKSIGPFTIQSFDGIVYYMSALVTQFENTLMQLVGKPCFNVQVGAIGSMASLHFGKKIPLENPLPYPNPSLTPDEHKFRGEFVLYIEDCPWRIENNQHVLATWLDSNAPTGPIVIQMRSLMNKPISDVTLIHPGMDLTITFDSDTYLRIFPDQTDPNEGDNYAISSPASTYIVSAQSIIHEA